MRSIFFLSLLLLICISPLCARERFGSWKTVDDFALKMASQNNMELLNSGSGILIDADKIKWCIALMDRRPVTKEQARPIALSMMDSFWNLVKTDPIFRDYLKQINEESIFGPGLIGIKIAFWDANTNRRQQPFLAQVNVTGQTISYFYADPITQALQPPVTESLQEARQKLLVSERAKK